MKFPEGFNIEKPHLDKFVGIAKEIGLKGEGAQKVADFYVEMQRQANEQHISMITKWGEEAKADPEIGGANFDKTLTDARRVLAKVGSPDLNKLLGSTGLGNHKEMIKLLAKLAPLVKEDALPGGSGGAPNASSEYAALKEAFPNSPEMWGSPQ